jgi:excisionase family DNA binding protein
MDAFEDRFWDLTTTAAWALTRERDAKMRSPMHNGVIEALAPEPAEVGSEREAGAPPPRRKPESAAEPNSDEKPKPKRKEGLGRKALSVPETAETLGTSEATVWRRIADGTLATVKLGGRRLVPISSIDDLLAVAE